MTKLEIPVGCHGHDLQELMYKFVNWFALANEKRDSIAYELSQMEFLYEMVEAKALLEVDEEIAKNNEGRISLDVRRARALFKSVNVGDGNIISMYDQKMKILRKQYELDSISSKVKDIERLISVCQSSLSFDRQEAGMPMK